MKTFKIKSYGKIYDCHFFVSSYSNNGNIAIEIETDEELFCDATVNLEILAPGYAYLDVNEYEGIEELFKNNNFGEYVNAKYRSGYVKYPLYKINIDAIREYAAPDSDYFML